MAPTTNKENHAGEVDDKTLMLKEALKCVKGTLDFEKLANQLNVANGEAMRKRFKRVFEKDDEPIVLKGSILGNPDDAKPTPKTQRTPKAKLAKSTSDGDETEPTPADGNKKRKATEAESEEDDGKNEAENTAAPGSPTKKPRATVKAPRTPKTPKTPKIPKTPQTPRSGAQAKASSKTEVTTADADEEADKTPQISEPAVQAKADAAVKETESAGGFTMGDPERQAKQDAVKASLSN